MTDQRGPGSRSRVVLLAVVVAVGVIVSLSVTGVLYGQADDRASLSFTRAANDAADAIVGEVRAGVSVAEAARAAVVADPGITREEYAAFVDQLALGRRFPAATGLAITVAVPADGVAELADRAAELGQPGLEVRPPEAVGAERWIILYNEPESVNAAAIGFDIRANPDALVAATAAVDQGAPRMTSPVTLVQETADQAGLVVYLPITTEPAEQGQLRGFSSIIFRGGELLEGVLRPREPLRVAITDTDSAGGLDGAGLIGVFDPRASEDDPLGRRLQIDRLVEGRPWTITVDGLGRFGVPLTAPTIALVVSLLLTATLAALVRSLQGREARAAHLTALATTDLRRSERDLAAANEALAATNADLERTNLGLSRSNAELARFAHVASHDLKEPIRMVSGFAGILRSQLAQREDARALTGLERESLDQIDVAARRMQALISDLLELASVESEPSVTARVDVAEEVQELLRLVAPDIADSGTTVRLQTLDPVVMDPRQVRGLLQNLIGNAVKFRRPDGAPVVEVEAVATPGHWTLRVTDNGIGIPAEQRHVVFEAFRRMHPRDDYDGTGIGLAICAQVARAHGGTITIEDGFDGGTSFVVRLPQGGRSD